MSAFALAALFAVAPVASDWPQFRGPNRDGSSPETGLLDAWPDGGPKLAWTAKDLGGGYSSVAVAGGVVYGTGLTGGQEHVWALDAATGTLNWTTPFAPTRKVGYGDGPRSTPTIAGGMAYVVGTGGTLAALDIATGKVAWTKNYVTDFGGAVPSWGYTESVLVDDGKVIGTPGSKAAAMVALDARTGAEVWRTPLPKSAGGGGGYASPVKAVFDGGAPLVLNVVGKDVGLVVADIRSGAVLFQYAKAVNGTASIPSPVVEGDKIFISTGYPDGGSVLLQVTRAGDTYTFTEVKSYKAGELQNHHGGVVLVGDHVYFGNGHGRGHPACVDLSTGDIAWKETRGAAGGDGSAAVAAADGKLVFRYQNGVVALIAADPKEFRLLSSFKLPDPSGKPSWPHPAISHGKLYLRDQGVLHCYAIGKE